VGILRSLVERAATDNMQSVSAPELTNNAASATPATVGNMDEGQIIVRILRETKGRVGGAKSVVASLWTANDPSTRTLMERFYRYIAGGEDKGSALHHAQMDLIAEFGDRALPLYWAGFILVGDGKIPVWPGMFAPKNAAGTPARE